MFNTNNTVFGRRGMTGHIAQWVEWTIKNQFAKYSPLVDVKKSPISPYAYEILVKYKVCIDGYTTKTLYTLATYAEGYSIPDPQSDIDVLILNASKDSVQKFLEQLQIEQDNFQKSKLAKYPIPKITFIE